jgi:hypothetical protein
LGFPGESWQIIVANEYVPVKIEKVAETRIASYLLTEYLERLGVEVVFGLCGHTVIAMLDALGKSRIRFITSRHEQIAAYAADGYARATGKVGVVLSHLGPGLTNATTGVATAALDSVPMVVLGSSYCGRIVTGPPGWFCDAETRRHRGHAEKQSSISLL